VKRFVLSCALAWQAHAAFAGCAAADKLIDKYGISFSGFERAIAPATARNEAADKAPDTSGTKAADLVVIALSDKAVLVNDGYLHHALIDRAVKRAWIHRTGGFIGVDEWYGPVHLPHADLDGCVVERYMK
jgi:hypothetical protein